MAMSKVEQTGNQLDLLWESRALYAEILFSFRECHDLCVSSDLFTKDIILKIDQCAVDFRQLSLDSVSVAKRVSGQWLKSAIMFFKHIDDVDKPQKMLKLLGQQARELSRCFKIIAAWARDLCGRFHEAQDGTIKEAEEFKKAFETAIEQAQTMKTSLEEEHRKAAEVRKNAQKTNDNWKIAQVTTAWNPLAAVITSIGAGVTGKSLEKASELEREAAEKLRQAQELLSSNISRNEKAKVIAGKAKKLVTILAKLEETCEIISAFWREQADNYDTQGAIMETEQVEMIDAGLKKAVAKDNIEVWEEAKAKLEKYATAMTTINSCFNFVTEAKPATGQTVSLADLKLTLSVPASINLKAIEMEMREDASE